MKMHKYETNLDLDNAFNSKDISWLVKEGKGKGGHRAPAPPPHWKQDKATD